MSHALFDALQAHSNAGTDAALAKLMNIDPRTLYDYRRGKTKCGAFLILQVYDYTGWSIERIRELMADKTPKKQSRIARQMAAEKAAAMAKRAETIAKKAIKQKPRLDYAEDAALKRLTVTKTPKWTSTVHRVL